MTKVLLAIRTTALFGFLAQKWFDLKAAKLKKSTVRDYRNCLNNFILPKFGNVAIDKINYLDIETFLSGLGGLNKRAINMLVPMRNVFKLALRSGFIDKNPIDLLDPIKPEKADINPFSMEEVKAIIENVDPYYKNFFIVAFFTGMRFGEMSALKWRNVDFRRDFRFAPTGVGANRGFRPSLRRSGFVRAGGCPAYALSS